MVRKKSFGRRKWVELNPTTKTSRIGALNVLDRMRKGNFLTEAAEKVGIDWRTAKKHLRPFLRKINGVWRPLKTDSIQRSLNINEDGQLTSIIVTNSQDASIVGEYHNAVKKMLKTGDTSALEEFEDVVITDATGVEHTLEIDPDTLFDIEEQKEDTESYTIYSEV